MNLRIKLSAELYTVNRALALKALNEATPATLEVRPMDKANSFAWVFGHITGSRFQIGKLIGLMSEFPWTELYNAARDVRETDVYPSIDKLKSAYEEIGDRLNERFEELTEVDLDGASVLKIQGVEKSVAGMISAFAFHEAYHVGQLAYIQRLHGGEKLVG
jgi:hypothetical protein